MSADNKVITKIEIAKTELEVTMTMRLNEFKSEEARSLGMKLSYLTSAKPPSSCDQPSVDIIK